jgi:hypothetical protein
MNNELKEGAFSTLRCIGEQQCLDSQFREQLNKLVQRLEAQATNDDEALSKAHALAVFLASDLPLSNRDSLPILNYSLDGIRFNDDGVAYKTKALDHFNHAFNQVSMRELTNAHENFYPLATSFIQFLPYAYLTGITIAFLFTPVFIYAFAALSVLLVITTLVAVGLLIADANATEAMVEHTINVKKTNNETETETDGYAGEGIKVSYPKNYGCMFGLFAPKFQSQKDKELVIAGVSLQTA